MGHPIFALDPRDDRSLAAYATDIYIGRVLNQTGAVGAPTSAPGQELPQSQFAVEVLHVLKGQARGVVTVNQVGGLDPQAGQTMLLEGTRSAPRCQRAVPGRVRSRARVVPNCRGGTRPCARGRSRSARDPD